MGSKGRIPALHLRRPPPGPGLVHPDAFGPGIHPPPGPFPPFEMLPPPEVMEQKLAAQHVEMQRLATENQRLAATHGTLRQELAAAKHELQMLHVHIGAMKSEREQQMSSLMDKIAKMEAELKDAEPVRLELQQARADAEKLVVTRQELLSKVHQLNQELHRVHADVQQIPALMSELESLRQECQQCRISYDSERKLFKDHLLHLQAMEQNYDAMAREVEKLRSELTNTPNVDIRTGIDGPAGGTIRNNENEASGRPVGQSSYEVGYGVSQVLGHAMIPANPGAPVASGSASAVAIVGVGAGTSTPNAGAQSSSAPTKGGPVYDALGYDAVRIPGYGPQGGFNYGAPGYDIQRGPTFDAQRGPGYDALRLHGYDVHRGPSYDAQRVPGYDMQRGPNYNVSRGAGYDATSSGVTGPHGLVTPASNAPPYGSTTPPTRAGNPAR